MRLDVTFLGTAASYGVPRIGCPCETCISSDPHDNRTRASIHVAVQDGPSLLVDVGPEIRIQALRERANWVDAVLFTHYHADHTAGIDDLKAYNAALGDVLPCYGDKDTEDSLRERFAYAFEGTPWIGLIPHIGFTAVDREPFTVGGIAIQPVPLQHGRIRATGYRIGDFAYLTDLNRLPDASRPFLQDLDTLVVDGLRWEPLPTHLSIPEALELHRQLRPKRTLFTHISHSVLHARDSARLPEGVMLAYDGLRIAVEGQI